MKSAQKSFLLTSIVIVVLLAVALSTATFAWFSASSTVTVSQISFTATSDNKISDLVISWDLHPEKETTSINFAPQDKMTPMIPLDLPMRESEELNTEATTAGQFTMTPSFDEEGNPANVSNFWMSAQVVVDDVAKYSRKPSPTQPVRCKAPETEQDVFYLINKNDAFDMEVTVEYKINGTIESALCVALFVGDGVPDGKLKNPDGSDHIVETIKFVGIMTNLDQISYGKIEKGTPVADQAKSDPDNPYEDIIMKSNDYEFSFTIPAGGTVSVILYAWLDGTHLDDDGIGETAVLTELKFNGAFVG